MNFLWRNKRSRQWAWLGLMLLTAAPLVAAGQEPAANQEPSSAPAVKKFRGRLPAHYGRVVSSEQREKIYQLQADYAAKVEALKQQMEKLLADRDAAVEGVLTADQRRQIAKLRDEAQAARAARAAAKAKAGGEPTTGSSADSEADSESDSESDSKM